VEAHPHTVTAGDTLARLEAAGRFGIVPGLERTRWLLGQLGDPHAALRGVLVAGTNGKGSVCALLDAMARAGGRRTALLAKPHLVRWGERIALDGTALDEAAFAALAGEVLDIADRAPDGQHPTQFEVLTAMGFLAAARHHPDTVICEVGMGGAGDSTSVAGLGGCVVTNVTLDHREWLGDTVEEIAAEKAGIAKPGDWLLTAATEPALSVIARRAAGAGATLVALEEGRDWRGHTRGRRGVEAEVGLPPRAAGPHPEHLSVADPVRVAIVPNSSAGEETSPRSSASWLRCRSPLVGRVQIENLAVAAAAAALLDIPAAAIAAGAASASWPGRLQWIDGEPPLLLDGAHNPAAMAALRAEVPTLAAGRRVVAVFGAMADKQLDAMLPELRQMAAELVLTSVGGTRAAPAARLAGLLGSGTAVEPVAAALETARRLAGRSGLVLVCGSLALVGAVLQLLSLS